MDLSKFKFFNYYTLVATTTDFVDKKQGGEKCCRFCGLKEPNVTFKTKAHVIPELLGRNNYIGYEECDSCNSVFSKYESHLASYFMPYLTLLGVSGKKKNRTFQSRSDENSPTIIKVNEHGQRLIEVGNIEDYIIDEENKTVEYVMRLPKHKPLYIYMALLKVGLTLLPNSDIGRYKNVFKFLLGNSKVGFSPSVLVKVPTKKIITTPIAYLFKLRDNISINNLAGEYVLVMHFGVVAIQVYLPLPTDLEGSDIEEQVNKEGVVFPFFTLCSSFEEASLLSEEPVNYKVLDLSSQDSEAINSSIYFEFDTIERNI